MKIVSKRAVVVLTAATVLLAGCGGQKEEGGDADAPVANATSAAPVANGVADLEPKAILEKAKAAAAAAKSFRVKGGSAAEGMKVEMDFKVSGEDIVGSTTIGETKVQVLSVGGQQFMKGDESLWALSSGGDKKQAAAVDKLIGDRWVKLDKKDSNFDQMFSGGDIDELLKPSGDFEKGETKTVDGKPAIGLVDKGSEGGTLWIATEGEPYPVRIDAKDPADGGFAFSDFGATFDDLKVPAAADVIDMKDLKG